MNCASNKPRLALLRFRPASGFTLVELLVATAVAMAFLSGVYMTFAQILRAQDVTEARSSASQNGRSALLSLTDELQTLELRPGGVFTADSFDRLDAQDSTYGDGFDNDSDGRIDEEPVNAFDDELTTGGTIDPDRILENDRHALIDPNQNLFERPLNVGESDLGDADVDEDIFFGDDLLIFDPIVESGSNVIAKRVTYALTPEDETFDGQRHVLLRQTVLAVRDPVDPGVIEQFVSLDPIAFGVLGFDLLFWDSNALPGEQAWLEEWDSTDELPNTMPASVYIRLTLYADARPIESYEPGQPVDTITLESIVNIDSVINSASYLRPGGLP